jgi:hypothetical protein
VARNRFEQVDELQPDAINLTLIQKSDGQVGIIHCPKTAAPDRLPDDLTSEEIPVRDALIGAIQMTNMKKLDGSKNLVDRQHFCFHRVGWIRGKACGDSQGFSISMIG